MYDWNCIYRSRRFAITLCVTVFLTLDLSRAQQTDSVDTTAGDPAVENSGSVITPEQRILSRLHQINQMEIEAARTAIDRGDSEWIVRYGKRLLQDHQSTDQSVIRLAASEDIELVGNRLDETAPRKPLRTFEQMMEQLNTLEGEEFDQLFLKMTIMSHRQSIEMLQGAVEELSDGVIREFVEDVIPLLDQHRRLARNIQSGEIA